MGFPPVVIGLLVYLLLPRSGPLGFLGWLFTPPAMVMAQVIICLPLVVGFTMAAVLGFDPAVRTQCGRWGQRRCKFRGPCFGRRAPVC